MRVLVAQRYVLQWEHAPFAAMERATRGKILRIARLIVCPPRLPPQPAHRFRRHLRLLGPYHLQLQ